MAALNRKLYSLSLLVLLALAMAGRVRAQEAAAPEQHPPAASGEAHPAEVHPAPASGEAHPPEAGNHEGEAGDGHAAVGHGDFGLKGDLPFWSGIAFVMFAYVVWKLDVVNGIANKMFNPVAGHEQREKQALANAESLTREANEILRKNKGRVEALDETVKATIAEASRDAAHTTGEILKAAQSEATQIAGRATLEIERVRDQTLHDIFDTLAAKVTEATEQRLRSQLQSSDQDRLIDETLSQMSGAGT